MGRTKKYGNITLTDKDRTKIEKTAHSQTEEYLLFVIGKSDIITIFRAGERQGHRLGGVLYGEGGLGYFVPAIIM